MAGNWSRFTHEAANQNNAEVINARWWDFVWTKPPIKPYLPPEDIRAIRLVSMTGLKIPEPEIFAIQLRGQRSLQAGPPQHMGADGITLKFEDFSDQSIYAWFLSYRKAVANFTDHGGSSKKDIVFNCEISLYDNMNNKVWKAVCTACMPKTLSLTPGNGEFDSKNKNAHSLTMTFDCEKVEPFILNDTNEVLL